MTIEEHPLQPFLPPQARLLFLGSFPPPRARWSMDFFYPNWINDYWRILGIIFYGDKTHFEVAGEKRFDREAIIHFATSHGLAFYDTATRVCRQRDNASDNYLEILQHTDIAALLQQIPHCQHIVTTGGKASEALMQQFGLSQQPAIGESVTIRLSERQLLWWRMPSSSRAYPLAINKKADLYRRLFTLQGKDIANYPPQEE